MEDYLPQEIESFLIFEKGLSRWEGISLNLQVRSSKALLDKAAKTFLELIALKNLIDLIIRFKSSEIMRHNISNVNVLILC